MRAVPVQAPRARCPRGERQVGEPLWHQRGRDEEGLNDEGALPDVVQALCGKPAKGDGKGWESGHPNLRRACLALELQGATVPTGEQRLLPMPTWAYLHLGAAE